ncbi:quinone oxidoreductase-like protein 1 [Trichonephila clavata]|uniref:Quinone oxidoreductase-like protein 1 n=1 Tax=Trichonephila clavata TaxID=2740835 RepID=A0A8X6L005_TRICU|nr:quinone oxidoreductase-like protein 1 [Trichonephila clavata]
MSVRKMRKHLQRSSWDSNSQTDLPPLTRYSVLIEVKACSLSEVDIKLMQLVSRDTSPTHYSVGKDIAGIIREIGNAVTTLKTW